MFYLDLLADIAALERLVELRDDNDGD